VNRLGLFLACACVAVPARVMADPRSCTAGWTEGRDALFVAVTGASLMAMVAAPVLAGWWSTGSMLRRLGWAALLAVAIGAAAVALGVLNFVLGNHCDSPWVLITVNAAPGLLLSALLYALWRVHRKTARLTWENQANPGASRGWALPLALMAFTIASAFAVLAAIDALSRPARMDTATVWWVVLRLGLEPLLLGLVVWWLFKRRRKAQPGATDATR